MRKDVDTSRSDFAKSVFLDLEVKKNADKGATYRRIVKANKAAKEKGVTYGKYMAGLWEEHARAPIDFGNFDKYRIPKQKIMKEQKTAMKLLEGDEANEYIQKLKEKAGAQEPKAKAQPWKSDDLEKARILNEKWSDACKELREHADKIKNMKLAGKSIKYKR